MSVEVQITLIICITIIILSVISALEIEYKIDNAIEHCKSPTYPAPPRPGISSSDALTNIRPPGNRKSTDTLEFSQEDE